MDCIGLCSVERKNLFGVTAILGPNLMKQLRRPTLFEWLTILAVTLVLGGLLLPDSASTTHGSLEKRARDFKPTVIAKLSDESILATDANLAGTWASRRHFDRSSFTFSPRSDGQLDVDFRTSGCFGGCELARTASVDAGMIQLNAAVAEYFPKTYDRLYVIQIDGREYLLPADSVVDFERERNSGSDSWNLYVFLRDNENIDEVDRANSIIRE